MRRREGTEKKGDRKLQAKENPTNGGQSSNSNNNMD